VANFWSYATDRLLSVLENYDVLSTLAVRIPRAGDWPARYGGTDRVITGTLTSDRLRQTRNGFCTEREEHAGLNEYDFASCWECGFTMAYGTW